MKKHVILACLVLLGMCVTARAQIAPQIQGAGAPANPCANGGQQYVDQTNHVLYGCPNSGGNWVNLGLGNLTGGGGLPNGCTSPGTGAITCTGTVTANIASVNSVGTNFIDDACGAQAVGNASQNRISCNGSNLPVDSVNGGVAQIIALNLCGSEPAPGAYTPTNTAGITECLQNGTYTVASLQTISANNVTIFCPSKATIIQRTGATGLFKFTGNYDRIVGCTLDGNSQSGAGTGPLIEMTGNDDVAEDMAVTNPGITNTASATILISNGSRNKVKYITFPAATDFTVSIHPTGTNVINDPLIDHVTMNCNPTTVVNCIDLNQASGTIINATVSWNTVYTGGTANDASAYFVAYTLPATNTSIGTRIDHNIAIATVNTNYLFHVFGIFGGSITNNLADDGGVTVQHDMYSLGDAYRSTISGNICNSSAGIQNCFNLADFGNDVISGNTARGIGNNGFGIQSDNEGSGARNSVFSNNTVILAAASDCFRIVNSNAGSSTADDIWVGNTCTGNSGAGENGFNFTAPAGTATDVSIRDNHLALLAGTGIIIGASVTNTTISGTAFDTVTTRITNSGTTTRIMRDLTPAIAAVTIGSGTSIGSTSICSTVDCPAGTYRVNVYVDLTTACGTTGTYLVNLIYTDDQGAKTVPVNINGTGAVPATGVLTTTSTANFGENGQIIRSTGAASINYSTTATACGTAGPMVGKLYLGVEPLQ